MSYIYPKTPNVLKNFWGHDRGYLYKSEGKVLIRPFEVRYDNLHRTDPIRYLDIHFAAEIGTITYIVPVL